MALDDKSHPPFYRDEPAPGRTGSFFKRSPSIRETGANMSRKGKTEVMEAKILEFEGHIDTIEDHLRNIHLVSIIYIGII